MKILLWLAAAGAAMAADAPRIVYTKVFPGSSPAYVWISVERSGAAAFKMSEEDDPDKFQIEESAAVEMFDLASKLDHFNRRLEAGLKVANMGMKTFRWEEGAAKTEAKFNYSADENARALQDWFERMTESEMLLAQLKRATRYDKLGVNAVVVGIQSSWDRKRLVGAAQFLPVLEAVAKNDTYIHMARERAAQLVDAMRAAGKAKTP
jgi:hypothetical protein